MKTLSLSTLILGTLLALASCGGGTGGTGSGGGSNAVSQGVITAKGSIFVNGIEFSTSSAAIKIDDNPNRPEAELKEGMVVKVRGTSDDATRTGSATQIEARDLLEGTISGVDDTNKTITVMGQTVRIEDNVTRLNDDNNQKVFAQANFQTGEHVEVHGFPDDQGGVRATRVFRKGAGEFESKGFVTGLGPTSFGLSLTPGGTAILTVNYGAGLLPAGTINDSFVEVKSSAAPVPPVGGAVTATLIHLEDNIGAAGEKVEVEGIVTSGTLADFVVNGRRVITNAPPVNAPPIFEGGTSDDFAVGVKLEAEGPLNASGAIVGVKISFRSNIKIQGNASGVTATNLVVLGKTVAINQFTRFDTPVTTGDHVEVRALTDRDNNLIATRIGVVGNPGRAFLQGPVTAASSTAGTLTILGTTVNSDPSTEWRVSNTLTEPTVSKAEFFSKINVNVTVVKVRWDNFTLLTAPIKEAEIEIGN